MKTESHHELDDEWNSKVPIKMPFCNIKLHGMDDTTTIYDYLKECF